MTKPWRGRVVWIVLAAWAALAALLYLYLNVFFQPERLVRKLEKRLNCRAAVGSVDLSLLSQPARLVIHDLALAERDEYARRGTPLKERPPLTNPLVTAERLTLTVSMPHLMVGKLHVQELLGRRVRALLIKPEEGDDSLKRLFDDPDEVEEEGAEGLAGGPDEKDDEDSSIDRLRLPATLRRARLEECTLVMELVKKDTRITWNDIDVTVTDVEIDPGNLEERNRASVEGSARVTFDHRTEPWHYGQMAVRGKAEVRPVDVVTRELKPEALFQVSLGEGTYVKTAPLVEAMAEKLRDLERYGLDLKAFTLAGDLKEESRLAGHYRDHVFTLKEDASLDFTDYQLGLRAGSWYESEENAHEFHSRLTAGAALTERMMSSVDAFLERKVGFLPPDIFRRLVGEHFLDDGRFTLKLITKGDIGHPKVAFSEKLPEVDVTAVKESAEDLIKNLRSLFR